MEIDCGAIEGQADETKTTGWAGEMAGLLTILHGVLRSSVVPHRIGIHGYSKTFSGVHRNSLLVQSQTDSLTERQAVDT